MPKEEQVPTVTEPRSDCPRAYSGRGGRATPLLGGR